MGNNLNQIAKALNIIVKMGGGNKAPEPGKRIESLRKNIKEHTRNVLHVLESRTVIWEAEEQRKARVFRKRK
ncbi:MAG: hypothetical protein LBI87_03475 [Candidatus Accumulibacter sp.]|nr:hypothetical protein [Accumulibacter sp.]